MNVNMLRRNQFSGIIPLDKGAVVHWWMQRLTAVVLLPIAIWFAFAVAMLAGASYETVVSWLQSPVVTTLLFLFVVATFYHIKLGMQVIIEDYVGGWLKSASLLTSNLACILLTVVGIAALLRVVL